MMKRTIQNLLLSEKENEVDFVAKSGSKQDT